MYSKRMRGKLTKKVSPAQSVEPIKAITPQEIKEKIGLLNTKKAHGLDLITPKMLNELPQKA
jgi:hypothetical protein